MRRLLAAGAASVLSFFIVLGDPEPACACDCGELPEEEFFDNADVVFAGTLTRVDEGDFDEDAKLEFAVDEVYKGEAAATQGALTASSGASCGWTPPVGEDYLVYANLEDGRLRVWLCNGSRPLEEASTALPAEGAAPIPGEVDAVRDSPWLYGLGAAALLTATGTAWWLLRRRHFKRV